MRDLGGPGHLLSQCVHLRGLQSIRRFFHNNACADAAKLVEHLSGSGFGFGDPLEFKQQFLKVLGEIANHFAVAEQF
ncbi:hypothetical protein SG09_56600 [Bradyrhizobium ottawaense]|nr:hypothetical protein SG09_56600 [Bradyrhizobium ottawaense]BBO12549.1 hypothetical protein TM102_40190 [Bradyrhizobium sp. TM102]